MSARNVTSWTESEITTLVQAWSEVEAKYPLLRCQRGTGTLHAKMYALFSRRSSFPRSSTAVEHAKQHIRGFVLFVINHDKERQQDGGRLWFDLSVGERNQRRRLVPRRSRGLTMAVSKETFVKLLKMERVQRWLGGNSTSVSKEEQGDAQDAPSNTSFLLPSNQSEQHEGGSSVHDLCPLTPKREQDGEELEEKFHIPVQDRSDTSTCSLGSDSDDDGSPMPSSSNPPPSDMLRLTRGEKKKPTTGLELPFQLKHRDCNILLESMMELQNKKMRRAVSKLRADVEGEVERSSEMLLSIITNHFKDPGSSGDVAFVTKVLNMQKQQLQDRFDQFDAKRVRDEATNRALLGQRYNLKG
ncbi:hypothetical protein PHYPSEUDO_013044 [Phytophthora pseudosyringae]|uniref:Uncharacterized protein n=1 Tax=Phytophthora pseudosyringae TaxID=221518 RepID=A0A8T1V6F6_9STRA|nr:hypothetical protein PHYPSEUDO_013044 [Phytophthora pseudosyringae]